MRPYQSLNPYTRELIQSYDFTSADHLEDTLNSTLQVSHQYDIKQRLEWIRSIGRVLEDHINSLADLAVMEMGKPIDQARAEIKKSVSLCQFYADHATDYLAEERYSEEDHEVILSHEPLGTVLGITPWNFPVWQIIRIAIPAIAAGNSVLIKPAENTPGVSLKVAELFNSVLPSGIFDVILVSHSTIEALISDQRIHGVSLTGSEKAGSAVAAKAGEKIKPSVLELGGNNAFIVMEDAPVEKTVSDFIQSRFGNNGQSCIAAKRLLVQQGIYEEFKSALLQELKTLKTGDPRDSQTNLGPLARTDLTDHLEDQVNRAIQAGARDVIPWKRDHNLVSPCLLEYEASNTVLQNEELFGPVISMLKFKEPEDAFTYSNASPFGLGVSLYTGDVQRMLPHLSLLQEGAVAINRPVQSDPKYPFGGVKKSGYGREMGKEGLLSFTNRKFITVAN